MNRTRSSTVGVTPVIDVMRAVEAPKPVLPRGREAEFTDRQREILDELGQVVFADGYLDLTMADLAARLNCSLRTLYALANSRNELVMIVIDRVLRGHGRAAHSAIQPDMTALAAIRAYLHAANKAVTAITPAFAADTSATPEGVALHDAHSRYLIDVTERLLRLAVERNEIRGGPAGRSLNTAALARMLGGLGRDFARPDVMTTLSEPPDRSANAMVDLVIDALAGAVGSSDIALARQGTGR